MFVILLVLNSLTKVGLFADVLNRKMYRCIDYCAVGCV